MGTLDDGHTVPTRLLLAQYLAGDRAAERALFDRHRDDLVSRARRHRLLLALKGALSAEDVVHEVFVRALACDFLTRFEDRGRGSLLAALARILDRVMVDECRRRGALKRGANAACLTLDEEDDGSPSMSVDRASPDPTPTSLARARELLDLCRRHLDRREAEVWQFIEVEGLSPAEAAARLGETPAAVRGVLFRARAKLVKVLESRSPEAGG